MRMIRIACLGLPLLALAACGPPLGWTRPETSLATAQLDRNECAALARDQAFRENFFGMPYGYGYGPYPGAFPWGSYGHRRGAHYDSFMWRGQRESDLQGFCLRARGYSLTPLQQ